MGRTAVWPLDHWLALANALAAVAVLGAVAAPLLRIAGADGVAAAIEVSFAPFCPQRPTHSFVLLGHQVPLEQRMLAMAAAQLVGGLAYVRLRGLPPLGAGAVVLLCAPMAWDVLSQMLGLRDSSWPLRTTTGALATLALVFWAYPLIDRFLAEVSVPKPPGAWSSR